MFTHASTLLLDFVLTIFLNIIGCKRLDSLPTNLHKLKSLQTLSCAGCRELKCFPEIKENMGRLRVLDFSRTGITEVSSSIRHLHGLEYLNLSYCNKLLSLPDSICSLSSLETLQLKDCPILTRFPEIGENMGRLRLLNFSGTGIIEVPSSIRHLQGLKSLDLSCCPSLSSLPDSIFSLSSLRTLRLENCPIKSFPEMGENMGMLRRLNFSKTDIIEVPSSIRHLQGLEYLDLSCCQKLSSLPNGICSLSSLKTLRLEGCPIKSFPEIGENMGRLRELDLRETYVIKIPSSIRHLHGLEHLDLRGCLDLSSLPDSIYSLSTLKTLQVGNCPKLKTINVELEVRLSSLQHLNLTCQILGSGVIWQNNRCSSLKTLNPWTDQRDEVILNHIYSLSSLVQLCMTNSTSRGIQNDSYNPYSLKMSCQRHELGMEGRIPSDIFHQSSLENLSLHNFNFKEAGIIPLDNWYLPSLQSLSLRYCNLVEGEVLNHVCHLSSLRQLDLQGNHFSTMPAGISRFFNLRVLNLSHCKNLQQIPKLPSSLQILDAHGSDRISSSSSILHHFHYLIDCFKSKVNQV